MIIYPSAWPETILPVRLSTTLVLMPSLAIQRDSIRPAGPAPTMSTSTLDGSILGTGCA